MTDELEPCPFCGTKKTTLVEYNSKFRIVCRKSPNCPNSLIWGLTKQFYSTKQEAIEAWNREARECQ